MSIDLLNENKHSLAKAARLPPVVRDGRPSNPATLWRWATKGLRGVRLETIKLGGVTCTSLEALERFMAKLNNAPMKPVEREDHEAVERELAAHGL